MESFFKHFFTPSKWIKQTVVWEQTERKITTLLKVRCSQPERHSLRKEERLSGTCFLLLLCH